MAGQAIDDLGGQVLEGWRVSETPKGARRLLSPAAKRHPVDGNTLIVRDLSRAEAVWVAQCLNHSGYERLLLLDSGVLDRVGLKALAALRVPPVPPEMDGISAHLRDVLDEQTLTSEACTMSAPRSPS